jgi:predicted PurR-regulated permease PerM
MALLLVFAGVSNIFLLSVVTIICAIIPAIGPAIVWIPVGLILLLTGDYMGAGIVLGGGVALISTVDNILRPVLVGRDTSLPDPIILISILGGIATFGIPGLIIGPISAGLALSLLTMFTDEYRTELENN